MPRVVSVIPPQKDKDSNVHPVQGTHVLLDDGSRLQGVHKVTLVGEPECLWKAIIEVYPTNQQQIDAIIQDLQVIKDG